MNQALKYDYSFNPDDDSIAARVCRLVDANKHVLELGCAAGTMSKVLHQHYHCTVTGVEFDPNAAVLAQPFCTQVLVGDLNQPHVLDSVSQSFDVVLMADVLEHLHQPETCLQQALSLLNDEGYVVISTPNIAHGGVIAALWCDAFDYGDTGLLDRTHIHFFTARTLYALLERAGLIIDHIEYADAGAWHHEFASYWEQIPTALRSALEQHPPAQAFQLIVRARRPRYPGEQSIALDRVPQLDSFAALTAAVPEPTPPIPPEPEQTTQSAQSAQSPAQPAPLLRWLQRCPRLHGWLQRHLSPELKAKIKQLLR